MGSYEIMDDAAQAFLKAKIVDNIRKYFYLVVFSGYIREQVAAAREAVEAEKKAAVALPTSGKCSIPATELKLGKTFVEYMEGNAGFRGLIETGKGNLGKIIHDICQTAHVMFGDMPQGDHKKRAKYRFASKTLMRILPAAHKAEVEGLIEKGNMTMDLYEILGKVTWVAPK